MNDKREPFWGPNALPGLLYGASWFITTMIIYYFTR